MEFLKISEYLNQMKQIIVDHLQSQFPDSNFRVGDINLETPPDPKLGEFAVACFPFAKILKKSPPQIASALAQSKIPSEYILQTQSSGPYLNIHVDLGKFIRCVCQTIVVEGDKFGQNEIGRGKKVMVEYSSPNTNKPLHIGHVRNNLIGMALANILEFSGFEVIKANLINDRGVHICKSMLAYQKHGKNKTPATSNVKGDHFVGDFYVRFDEDLKKERQKYAQQKGIDLNQFGKDRIRELKEKISSAKDKDEKRRFKEELQNLNNSEEKFEEEFLANSKNYAQAMDLLVAWEKGDREIYALWKEMRQWVLDGFDITYRTLGCKFDKIYFESDTYTLGRDCVEQGLKSEAFYRKDDGSICCSAEKLQHIAPESFEGMPLKDKVLLRGDGTSVYITQDIGTAALKYRDFQMDRSIYVVAEEQTLHFKVLFSILKLLGFPYADHCHHLPYGMVTLPRGMGKIKSREGTAADADDLIEEMVERAKQKIDSGEVHVPEDSKEKTALEIALAALKIFILQVSLEKNIQFDPEKTIEFTGDTGPAIQYSHARICSMLRKAQETYGVTLENVHLNADYSLLNTPEEIQLAKQLSDFPQVIVTAGEKYQIHLVANYLLALTKAYAKIYQLYPVLKSEGNLRAARLMLAQATAQVLKNGMNLLGSVVPDRM